MVSIPLLECGKNVSCVVEVVLVQRVVLHGCSDEPGSLGGFDEKTTTSGDSSTISTIEVVISCPAPHVFDIGRGGARQMDEAPCCLALIRGTTTVDFDLAPCCTTNSEVSIEEANVARVGSSNVNLDL